MYPIATLLDKNLMFLDLVTHGHSDEYQREHRKNKSLNKSYEYLQKQKRQREKIWTEKTNDNEQYFSRKNIAE